MPGRDLDESDIHRLWKEKADYMTQQQQQTLIQSLQQQTIDESKQEKVRMTQQILERDTELHKTKASLASLTHALSVREGDVKELRSTLSSHNSTIIHFKHEISSGEGQGRDRLEVVNSLQHALSKRKEQLRELNWHNNDKIRQYRKQH
uniref:Uncharacterized protein n=1 Tax=Chaetoceros debilis TaxID=122233 RepID=A0A6S8ZG49_9STRA